MFHTLVSLSFTSMKKSYVSRPYFEINIHNCNIFLPEAHARLRIGRVFITSTCTAFGHSIKYNNLTEKERLCFI